MHEDLEGQFAGLNRRINDLQTQLEGVSETVLAMRKLLTDHVPRPDGRASFKSIYNVADALAWQAAGTSAAFVAENMPTATMFESRYSNLKFAADNAPTDGLILEFGVGHGVSIRWLKELLPGRRVVGFDSFEGLPEDWRSGYSQGSFGDVSRGQFEELEIRVGWFDQTLPYFLSETTDPIALLHVDCDLYSSTATVLRNCMPRLAEGAIVVFDEFLNYPGWQHHEAKAWQEYVRDNPCDFDYLGFVPSHEQIVLRVNR